MSIDTCARMLVGTCPRRGLCRRIACFWHVASAAAGGGKRERGSFAPVRPFVSADTPFQNQSTPYCTFHAIVVGGWRPIGAVAPHRTPFFNPSCAIFGLCYFWAALRPPLHLGHVPIACVGYTVAHLAAHVAVVSHRHTCVSTCARECAGMCADVCTDVCVDMCTRPGAAAARLAVRVGLNMCV